MLNKICHQCKKEFKAKTKRAKFCSKKCRDRDFKIRHPNYDKEQRDKDREKFNKRMLITNKNWRKNHPKKFKEIKKRNNLIYRQKNPEKIKVQRNGWKKRSKTCFICGLREKLEFHHSNYEKNIGITLCFKCHRNLHKIIKRRLNK